MNESRFSALLKLRSAEVPEKTAYCPEDQEFAEYFEGKLSDRDHHRIVRHVQHCGYCLARAGLLGRLETTGMQTLVPETVLAAAKQLNLDRQTRIRRLQPLAAAAMLVLAIFAGAYLGRNVPGPAGEEPGMNVPIGESTRSLRNLTASTAGFGISVKLPEGPLTPGSTIHWTAPADPLRYELSVLSAAGDIVWVEQLVANQWVLGTATGLDEGADYFLRVEAILRNGHSVSSVHVPFRMAGKP